MRVARARIGGQIRCGLVEGDTLAALPEGTDVLDVLNGEVPAPESRHELAGLQLLAPIVPATIRDFSVFEAHLEGAVLTSGPDTPVPPSWYERPFAYFTNPHTVSGPGDAIESPPGTQQLDLELEVAVVVGKPGRNLTVEEASEMIVGYTIFNDWSARDLGAPEVQSPFGQFKGKDFANTLGPWIVTPDELEPFRTEDRLDLDMRAAINGVELGDDTLANMAWSFEELIAFSSRCSWVKPGDVIGSGTCAFGCLIELWGRNGEIGNPPALVPGDEVTLSVQGIGTLSNTVVAGPAPVPLPPARPGRLRSRALTGQPSAS